MNRDRRENRTGRRWWTITRLNCLTVVGLLAVAIPVVVWFVRRDRLPRTIRVATADEHGFYLPFGNDLCEALNGRNGTGRAVALETTGSLDNEKLLRRRKVHLALIQGGTVDLTGELCAVAPLFPEVAHVLVLRDPPGEAGGGNAGQQEPGEESVRRLLAGKRAYLGDKLFSGMRRSAEVLLAHYGLGFDDSRPAADRVEVVEELGFWQQGGPPLTPRRSGRPPHELPQVAIVTMGRFNPRLEAVLRAGNYRFLSIDAEALSRRHAYLVPHRIPKGAYGYDRTGQPVPRGEVVTVATKAFLAARIDASPRLVDEALAALYERGLRSKHADLILARDALNDRHGVRFHPASRVYYEPWDVDYVSSLVETMAGSYELVFALGAGLYLLWTVRWRWAEKKRRREMRAQKDHLDRYLERAMAVEAEQMAIADPEQLKRLLEDCTRIKLEALRELTHEDLRGDRTFSIFLLQCNDLISRIQSKIIAHRPDLANRPDPVEP